MHTQTKLMSYQPKTGEKCHCKAGIQRDNCPDCEGTGMRIDFRAIHEKAQTKQAKHTPTPWHIGAGDEQDGYGILGNTKPSKLSLVPGSTVSDHVAIVEGEANAALIIKCVNSHQELLGALQMIVRGYELSPLPGMETDIAAARAAIEKATL